MKILPVGAELFHADRQTDMTKLRVAFHSSTKVPKDILKPDRSQMTIGLYCDASAIHSG